MIPKECKRLAEVDFPIAEVSRHAAREKSMGWRRPSTLHLWWATKPLAACRAMLLALLWPDPCDPCCPPDFKRKARELLPSVQGTVGPSDQHLRKALLRFIADFSNGNLASSPQYLEVSRALVDIAQGTEAPLVVDPFAGSGSIPLEALRVGCEAFASDLNPVACLILKVMLEDIPRQGLTLCDDLRRIGDRIIKQAERELAPFYPTDADGSTPIAYLWARTVQCESPNCGSEVPLISSFWLCNKTNRKRALRWRIARDKHRPPHVEFDIFEPKLDRDVPVATVVRAKATCLACGAVLPPDRVRAQLASQRGGADVIFDEKGDRVGGARLLAVVTVRSDQPGRGYRLAKDSDYQSVFLAQKQISLLQSAGVEKGPSVFPDETISMNEVRRISVPLYGATTWGDLFTARQKLTLSTYSRLIRTVSSSVVSSRFCALALDRLVMVLSAHCRWKATGESLIDMFGQHSIGMTWTFAESTPGFRGNIVFGAWLTRYEAFVENLAGTALRAGQIEQRDATSSYLPHESCQIWFTDPPYYDAIPYAHLSDCFYVWLKRALPPAVGLSMFDGTLSPKDGECVVDRPHKLSTSKKDARYFEAKITDAARVGRHVTSPSGCGCVVFAHKTTEGWEALLSGIVTAEWCITASWPIATELGTRLNARDTASLATSVHLVCRPRAENAPTGDWAKVLRELPNRVRDWMERLESEGVRGADLVFACIGPALEIFSRYSRVETADGREVSLGEYLEKVWEVVGRTALEQVLGTAEARARNGAAGAVEEDARLTALFLWTLQSTNGEFAASEESEEDEAAEDEDEEGAAPKAGKGYSLVFDVVRRFAQPLGINLPKWENRIIETRKGVVRLLAVSERSKQLFGKDGSEAVADLLEKDPLAVTRQLTLFADQEDQPVARTKAKRRRTGVDLSEDAPAAQPEATTLDRVHAAMLLQAGGRTNALRALLKAEQERGPYFLRLANALSALYPKGSEEKRLLDAMLLAMPR